MSWKVVVHKKARPEFSRLDRPTKERIRLALDMLAKDPKSPDPMRTSKNCRAPGEGPLHTACALESTG